MKILGTGTTTSSINWGNVQIWKPEMVQTDVLVDICEKDNDRYPFGHNGQMKDNEWAGIGNHNSAEFWEYDTRTALRLNPDPIVKPWESSYSSFSRTPIWKIDPNGDADFYNQKGKYIGNDGNRGDGKIIVVTNNKIVNQIEKGKASIEMISPKDQFQLPPYDHRQEIKQIMSTVKDDADYEVGGRGILNASRDGMIHVRAKDGSSQESDGYKKVDLSTTYEGYEDRWNNVTNESDYLQYRWHSHPGAESHTHGDRNIVIGNTGSQTKSWVQQPSDLDIDNAGEVKNNFVVSEQDDKVYFYNKDTEKEPVSGSEHEAGSSGNFPLEKFYDVKEGMPEPK